MSSSGGAGRGSLPPKLYFRIGEVAGLVGVEPHVLRYWEREFRSIRPTKSAKGQRVYSRRDVENLLRVRELLYSEGFTIAGAKKRLLRSGSEPATATTPTSAPQASHVAPSSQASSSQASSQASPAASEPARAPTIATPASVAPSSLHAAAPAKPPSTAPASGPVMQASRVREKLTALRSEVEAFLKELGG